MNEILRLSLPVTASAICLPLSSLLDSVLAPRLLGRYVADPVATYGLFAGGAMTIINLPVSLCYGFAAASVPAVATAAASDEDGRERRVRRRIWFALGLTVALALPSAIGLYAFASPIVRLIYRSLEREELATLIKLVRALAIGEVFSACVQTLAACLTAQGKPRYAARATFVGVTVKTVLYCAWLRSPKISVYGMAYATNACYLIAFLLDLVYNLKVSRAMKTGAKGEESDDYGNRIGRRERGFDEAR